MARRRPSSPLSNVNKEPPKPKRIAALISSLLEKTKKQPSESTTLQTQTSKETNQNDIQENRPLERNNALSPELSREMFPRIGMLLAPFLDPGTIVRAGLCSKWLYEEWVKKDNDDALGSVSVVTTSARYYFRITSETERVANILVKGGMDGFCLFLAQVSDRVEKGFGKGLRAPTLYRALLAEQAIRRIDGSSHPLLNSQPTLPWLGACGTAWKFETDESESESELENDDLSTTNEQQLTTAKEKTRPIVPTLDLCFGSWSEMSNDVTRMLLPKFSDTFQLFPRLQKEKSKALFENHREWVTKNARYGSWRWSRCATKSSEMPFVPIITQGIDSYQSFVVAIVNDDVGTKGESKRMSIEYFSDYQIESMSPSRPFHSTKFSDITSLLFAMQSGDDNANDWSIEETDPFYLIIWATFAQIIGIPGFENFDRDAAYAMYLEDQEKAPKRLRLPNCSHVEIRQSEQDVLLFYSNIQFVVP